MFFHHRGVFKIDCRDCLKRRYNFSTGEPDGVKGPDGKMMYYDLSVEPNYKPKCLDPLTPEEDKCPRGNPIEGPTHDWDDLSWSIVETYYANKEAMAQGFSILTPDQKSDMLLLRCFGILRSHEAQIEAENEYSRTNSSMMELLTVMMLGTKGGGR